MRVCSPVSGARSRSKCISSSTRSFRVGIRSSSRLRSGPGSTSASCCPSACSLPRRAPPPRRRPAHAQNAGACSAARSARGGRRAAPQPYTLAGRCTMRRCMKRRVWVVWSLGLVLAALRATALDIDPAKVVDLTYGFGPETVYWPTAKHFALEVVSKGESGGHWYEANNFCAAEHGGTHMDAPAHFARGGASTDQVPVTAGIGPLVRVDVSQQAARDADYRLTP